MNSIQEVREMRTAEMELGIIRERRQRDRRSRKWSLESRAIRKSVKHGSEGGGWKSARKGNSLAAYPTHVRFEVAGDGNQDMVRAGEALLKETGSNGYVQPTSQAPSPDPTSRPPRARVFEGSGQIGGG